MKPRSALGPVLVFDGDCGFCSTSARSLERWSARRGAYRVEAWQRLDLPVLGLTEQQCVEAVQWVDGSGRVESGHLAIAAALRAGHPVGRPVAILLRAPLVSPLAARVYGWVADHRYALPGGTPACGLPPRSG